MSDITSAPTVTTPATPAAPTPDAPSFTRVPIAVAPEAVTPPAETAKPATLVVDAPPADVVSALAKANSEARKAKQSQDTYLSEIADLKTKLEQATSGSARSAQLEAEIQDMIRKPKKYLQRYNEATKSENSLAEILNGFAAEDDVEDPEVVALKKRLDDRDAKDAEAAERAKTDSEKEKERRASEINQSVNKVASDILKAEGSKPDSDGIERWSLISDDASIPERARLAALEYVQREKIEVTDEVRYDLLCQAFDHFEKQEREKAVAKAARLKLSRQNLTDGRASFTLGNETRNDSSSQRTAPVIDSGVRGSLPPPSGKDNPYSHGFTPRR
jgi:hypothetical protein